MREHLETSTGLALTAGTYSGYSLHAHEPEQGINLILSQPGISSSRVTRLSPTAVWALPEPGTELPPRERPVQLLLDDNGRTIGPLRGEIFWSDPRRADAPFGIQFVDVTLEQGRQILSVLDSAAREGRALPAVSPRPIEEAIVDSERIRSILKSVCVMQHQGLLRQPGRTLRVSLEYFDVAASRLHWRLEEPSARWGQAPHDIEVVGYNSAFRMRVPEVEVRGGRLVTPIPRRLWRVRHRARRRVPAPAGLMARFHHPLWNELGPRERELQDVSFTGLSVLGSADDLVFPGLILQPLEVIPEYGEPLLMRAEVRYVGKPRPDGQRVLGLQVTPQTPEDEARWMQLVSQALCPDTRAGEEWLEALWQLLADVDYHQLAGDTPEDFEQQRASFVDTSLRAAREPQLSCQAVWPSERGVEATLSSVRAWRHGWLVHQLAKRPGAPVPEVAPGRILRELHLRALEHAQNTPDFRWLLSYVDSSVPFFERLYLSYARRHADTGEALVLPVHLWRARCDEPSGQPSDGIDVGPATAEETEFLASEIARTRPACYVEAMDLSRERLALTDATQAWHAAGLERERQVLVAHREGMAVAAIVLERGPEGMNLLRMLDTARLFPLVPGGQDTYVALLDAARTWYAARGLPSFVLVSEEDDDGLLAAARLREGPGTSPCLWLLSAHLLPEFLEHVSEATVGRLPSPAPTA
ncbi:hypothetical protein [Cystobacter ferrugineus]|uniref:PilZ domain-containing protein n=1 Tax=Cystobacter ferrugineus TaxID=83449 RepID=A0A1L9B597_9BACT|nr:hypothetical protein [Cystobacter ferrugineus]OJH37428.1 hypothetical protein BON30_29555 [Cystobacter ferrugineus]